MELLGAADGTTGNDTGTLNDGEEEGGRTLVVGETDALKMIVGRVVEVLVTGYVGIFELLLEVGITVLL